MPFYEARARFLKTSGSGGDRLQVLAQEDAAYLPFGFAALWNLPRGSDLKVASLTTPRCSATECHLGHSTFEDRLAADGNFLTFNSVDDLFSISDATVANIMEELDRYRPEIIEADPF